MSAGTWVAETENAEEPDLDAKMEESTGEKESVKQNPPSRGRFNSRTFAEIEAIEQK